MEWIISTKGKIKSLPGNLHPDDYDFDHPTSLDFNYILKCLQELLTEKKTESPLYCFKTHKRLKEEKKLFCKDVLVFEGILSLYDERIRNLFDLKIFIQCDADIALARRIKRDIKDRGRDINEVLTRYNRFVKEDFQKFVKPQAKYVDLIIPGGANNDKALNLLAHNLSEILNEKRGSKRRKKSFVISYQDSMKICLDNSNWKINSSLFLKFNQNRNSLNNLLFSTLESNDNILWKTSMKYFIKFLFNHLFKLIKKDLGIDNFAELNKNEFDLFLDFDQEIEVKENKNSRFVVIFTHSLSDKNHENVEKIKKNHLKTPIYHLSLFGQKSHFENLIKESCLLKILCLFPLDDLNEFDELVKDKLDKNIYDISKKLYTEIAKKEFLKIFK